MTDLEAACLHEAAHCVVAHVLGLDPAGCFVDLSSQTGDGNRPSGGTVVDTFDAPPLSAAMVALAGYAAGELAGMDRRVNRQRSGDDLLQFEAIMGDVPEGSKVGPTVFRILRDHWPLVLAVSAALAVSGTVDREELARLAGSPQTAVQAPLSEAQTFGILARTELGRSVYHNEVTADAPEFWWGFNEGLAEGGAQAVALNAGSTGSAADGTYVGQVDFGRPSLIVNDPGSSIGMRSSDVFAGVPVSGVNIPVSEINLLDRVNNRDAFTLEVWVRPTVSQTQALVFFMRDPTGSISSFALFWFNNVGGGNTGQFRWRLAKTSTNYDLDSASSSAPPDKEPYHVVLTGEQEGSNLRRRLYLNGTQVATDTVAESAFDDTGVDHNKWGGGVVAGSNFTGEIQEGAIYLSVLSSTRIAAHYDAGSHPWQGDAPGERLDRVLDEAGWPDNLRETNAGSTTFQSASITGQSALEHAQKCGESEAGLFFADRAGNVVLRDQSWIAARTPYPIVFGDGAGKIGFRSLRPDDSDENLRNSATISRLNGVAKTSEDGASVTEFGRFSIVLDGLLHDTDAWSQDYADFVVAEYKDPRRRVTEITVGPPPDGEEDLYYPAMLGLELGDVISLSFTPSGLGDPWTATAVIEGIRHSSAPGRNRTVTFTLSPEFTETLFGV